MAGSIVVILGIAGAIIWYQRPTKTVTDAFAKAGEAQTQAFRAQVTLTNAGTAEQLLGEQGTVEVVLDGVFERQENQRAALQSAVSLVARSDSVAVEIEGNVRFVGDKVYLEVKKAPPAIPVLVQLKDRWIELPRGGEAPGETAAAGEAALFTNVKRVGREEVAGKSTLKYEATVTEAAIVQFMDAIARLLGTQLTTEQIDNLRQNLAERNDLPITIWATPLQHELRQFAINLAPGSEAQIRYTITLTDRNQAVTITAPEGAQTLEAVLSAGSPAEVQ